MKTKLLHKLRVRASKRLVIDEYRSYSDMTVFIIYYKGVKLFTEVCTPDEYEKAKELVFRTSDRIIRESILKELNKYK